MSWRFNSLRTLPRSALLCAALLAGAAAGHAQPGDSSPLPVGEGQGEAAPAAPRALATFAGGCFWCVESDFDHVPGVLRTVSGFTGGRQDAPTYKQVSAGGTGHLEAVQITFDPAQVSFAELVEIFWRSVDPTDDGGQFCDRGESYKTAIFTHSAEQARIAGESKQRLEAAATLGAPVVTPIIPAGEFHAAAAGHQNYYKKNPLRYRFYRANCRRDARIEKLWGFDAHRGIEK